MKESHLLSCVVLLVKTCKQARRAEASQLISRKYFGNKVKRLTYKMKVEELVELYRKYAFIPSVSQVNLQSSGNHLKVSTTFSERDLERSLVTKFSRHYYLNNVGKELVISSPAEDVTSYKKSDYHIPTGRKAVLVKDNDKNGKEKQFVEIWSNEKKEKTFDMEETCNKEHGKIYDDGTFGCLSWSPDGSQIIYVAEKKTPEMKSFFKTIPVSASGEQTIKQGEEYAFKEDWGEQLVGKFQPVLCKLDVNSGTVSVCPSEMENMEFSAGPAIWSKDGDHIVFAAWPQTPFRLGLIYCPIRKNLLMCVDKNFSKIEKLVDENSCSYSPKFSPDGSKLTYFSQKAGGPHCKTASLHLLDWKSKQTSIIVDIVQTPQDTEFPGLYVTSAPKRIWSNDNNRIIFSSLWRSRSEILCCNIETKEVVKVTNDETVGSWTVLDVFEDFIVASGSSLDNSSDLRIGKLPAAGSESKIQWTVIYEGTKISGLNWNILPISYNDAKFEAIYSRPDSEPRALIVFPHGGPHSCSVSSFSLTVTLLNRLGYACLFVNYRGSIGFGEANVNALPGNVGTMDVQDVVAATDYVVEKYKLSPEKLLLFGGSHGGFLVAHLSGQYPDKFKACVTRNPAIELSAMIGSSDIPDWPYVEAGFEYNSNCQPSVDPYTAMKTMLDKSPMRYAHQVKVPTLFQLGQLDRRVHFSQGMEYYRALKSSNVNTKIYMYQDCHPLDKVEVESDCFIHAAQWFLQYS